MGLRVLIQSTSVLPIGTQKYGGIELMCSDMIRAMVALGQDVWVAAPKGSILPKGANLIETVKLPEEQDRDDIAVASMMGIDYDIFHDFSHQQKVGRVDVDTPAIFHNWNPMTIRYEKALYNALCVSQWQADRYEQMYARKTRVMRPWYDDSHFVPISNPRRERFLFLGKLTPEKGAHLALQWAKELNVPLDIVGGLIPSDPQDYLKVLEANADGNKIRVIFNADEAEKLDLLQNSKAVIYPVQQEEAHWLVGIEAWACNTPTIVLNRGAMREVCPDVCNTQEDFIATMKGERRDYSHVTDFAKFYRVSEVSKAYLALYKQVVEGLRW